MIDCTRIQCTRYYCPELHSICFYSPFVDTRRFFPIQEKSGLLRFVTGSPWPPLSGFSALPGGSGDVVKFQLSCTYRGRSAMNVHATTHAHTHATHTHTTYSLTRAILMCILPHTRRHTHTPHAHAYTHGCRGGLSPHRTDVFQPAEDQRQVRFV